MSEGQLNWVGLWQTYTLSTITKTHAWWMDVNHVKDIKKRTINACGPSCGTNPMLLAKKYVRYNTYRIIREAYFSTALFDLSLPM